MPAPMQLTTDWITIGTAGPTVDGRNISDQMLMDAAETYDPDEYTAVISSDHMLWLFGNFGEVCKLRTAQDKKGRTALQARIHPNRRLIEMNNQGQRMHTSMELDTNFAGTGKTYLMGLAVTDEPASLGTTALKFARKNSSQELMIGAAVALESFNFDQASNKSGAKDPAESFFKTLFQKLVSEQTSAESNANHEESDMTEEQFNALKELHEKHLAATENLYSLLKKTNDQQETEAPEENENKKNDNEIKALMTEVKNDLKSFKETLDKATAGQPGTQTNQNTGAGAEASFL